MTFIIENLDFNYGNLVALRGISARTSPGTITALIGPNASGKSTLLRLLSGFLTPGRGSPGRGSIILQNRPVHRIHPRQLAALLAYVPQRSIVSAAFTVREVVELGRYALSSKPDKIEQALETLDLLPLAGRPYPELSVGQQQRVMLARALSQLDSSGVLLLDEPTAALDLRHITSFMSILKDLARSGVTVIMAVHDLSLAAALADSVWMLDRGRLIASGPVAEVMTPLLLEKTFGTAFSWLLFPGNHSHILVPGAYAAAREGDIISP